MQKRKEGGPHLLSPFFFLLYASNENELWLTSRMRRVGGKEEEEGTAIVGTKEDGGSIIAPVGRDASAWDTCSPIFFSSLSFGTGYCFATFCAKTQISKLLRCAEKMGY